MSSKPCIEDDPKQFEELIENFRLAIMKKCQPLADEPEFHTTKRTLIDYLRARKYNLNNSVEMLLNTMSWRREYKPLSVDCKWCHQQPGYHSIRQVGHDKIGRPVFYSCFSQALTNKNTAEDTISHCVQMLENAKLSLKKSATNVVFVFDCSGMTLPCCNPKLGKGVMNVFANYYPEFLGKAIVLNHKSIFYGIWKAIRSFLDPITANKMVFLRKKDKISGKLREHFDDEMSDWLEAEISLNKDIPENQYRFWEKPQTTKHKKLIHDPRGSPSYVTEYIDAYDSSSKYQPHPNIVDFIKGILQPNCEIAHIEKHVLSLNPIALKEYGIETDESYNSDVDIF